MCTIMPYCGISGGTGKVMDGLKTTVSRGPDDQRIVKVPDGILGFQRLSIMGLTPEGMQPFELDGDFAVCNGEIYGFRKLRDKLIDMGAQIILCDPHRATVIGLDREHKLRGVRMASPDIRAGVALLIAALSADGKSRIDNIEQIDRGYQCIDRRLAKLGAEIRRVD